jgi:hypothetical protein
VQLQMGRSSRRKALGTDSSRNTPERVPIGYR